MLTALLLAGVAAYAPPRLPLARPALRVVMCEPPKAQSETDVQAAAAAAKALLEEEKQRKLDILFNAPPPIEGATETSSTESMAYLLVREELVGTIDSSSLLNLDEASDLWPEHLSPAAETDRAVDKDMWWVDELSCVGCTWCADVARSTFRMQNDDCAYGQARVIQQGGDNAETVEEAIACCPADCIHPCTRDELELLEEYRSLGYTDDLLARFQASPTSRSQGDGGGSMAAPHWRDPITHQGWRKGEKYIKSRRLRMEDPLLHHSGDRVGMSLIGHHKVNDAPSPQNQDGTVLGVPTSEVSSDEDGDAERTAAERIAAGLDLAGAVELADQVAEEAAEEEAAAPAEAPTEFLKAVGEEPASKQNPWD